jgi:HEAT repeat protein
VARAPLSGRAAARAALALLSDRDPRVRAAAARAAAVHGGKAATRPLIRLAARSHEPEVVAAVIAALGEVPGAEALAQLVRWAGGASPEARLWALAALAGRDEVAAREAVQALATDPDPRLRVLAARSATDPEALRRALGDATAEVRIAAVAPLVKAAGAERATGPVMRAIADAHGGLERVLLSGAYLRSLSR